MLQDHAATRLRQVVAAAVSPTPVVWARYQGNVTYPWCVLQFVAGPDSVPEQRKRVQLQMVTWTIAAGAPGAVVAARIGGRVLFTPHTGNSTTTAQALASQMPAHWSAVRVANVWTISGPDILAAIAYEGGSLTTTAVGEPFRAEVSRRTARVQVTVWTQLDSTGRPARWDPTGCDTLALKAQTALRQILPDPYRIYVKPEPSLRPFDESFGDGREYLGTAFDADATWIDFDEVRQYGFGPTSDTIGPIDDAEISPLEAADGTLETSDGVATDITTWDVDSTT